MSNAGGEAGGRFFKYCKPMKLRFSGVAAACAVACAPALAQTGADASSNASSEAPSLPPTVVTATRVEQPLTDVLADVTLIDEEQIRTSSAVNIADLLVRQPGLAMARNGGPGTATSMYIRGAENRFTAVYVNGVRVDGQATGGGDGGAPWEAISLDQVERIEIVRGPAAAVYGSDAVAGVIQIFTKRGEGAAFSPYVGAGVGSHRTKKVEAGFSGQQGAVDYSFGAARSTSRGFDAHPPAGLPDKDGYKQTSVSGTLGVQFNPQHRLELAGTHTDMDAQYDNDYTYDPSFDDRAKSRLSTLGASWIAQWTPDYRMRFSVSESHQRVEDSSESSVYLTKTRLRNWLLHNEWRRGAHTLTAALERREDKAMDKTEPSWGDPPLDGKRHQNAIALGWGFAQGAHTAQVNLRHDRDSEFGGQTTGSASYGYAFAPGWRATIGAGTAFRVPTLYQRFSPAGNPDLRPQKSRNVEVGVRYENGPHSAGVTIFHSRVNNLVRYVSGSTACNYYGCFENVERARLRGITFTGATRLGQVNLSGSLDLLDPKQFDQDSGAWKLLSRRPRRQLKLAADTRLHAGSVDWTLGAEWQASSYRMDSYTAPNTWAPVPVRLGGYGVLNLYAQATIARDWQVLARIDNLADKKYEHVYGYATPGRSVWLGVRWQPRY